MTDDDGTERPVALDAYETLAEAYSEQVDEKPFNAFLERPATRALLPAIDDERVLDAGCGPGVTTRDIVERGGDAIGVDVSPRMLTHARERVPAATFVRADLGSPLPFAECVFDGVHSSLAFHYVRDWVGLFCELARVLRPGGWLVASVQHPFADFRRVGEDYFAIERITETWTGFDTPVDVSFHRRPLEAIVDPLLQAGFRLERLIETQPTDRFRATDPKTYERIAREPTFLSLRARTAE